MKRHQVSGHAPRFNQSGQAIGAAINAWQPRPFPTKINLQGVYCRLEPLDQQKHQADLLAAYQMTAAESWTYLFFDALNTPAALAAWFQQVALDKSTFHFAIIDQVSGKALGTFALMRIDQNNGTIEVGSVVYSDLLKQTRLATEAQYLLAKYIFETLNYRRYEWKCDSLNTPSRQAALRLGFTFEGIFRQAIVYKNRSRDTAWFAIIDQDWPKVKASLEQWLAPDNFDQGGQQKISLNTFQK